VCLAKTPSDSNIERYSLVLTVKSGPGFAQMTFWRGTAATLHLSAIPDVSVYGLSRRSAPLPAGVIPISVDLLNVANVRQQLGAVKNVTHIVFGAYIERQSAAEKSEVNVAILKNLLGSVCAGV